MNESLFTVIVFLFQIALILGLFLVISLLFYSTVILYLEIFYFFKDEQWRNK